MAAVTRTYDVDVFFELIYKKAVKVSKLSINQGAKHSKPNQTKKWLKVN